MNHQDLVATIKKLGFTEYEAKCYLALFEKESLTVSEVASLAEIPRPNAYETMERLLAKGLSASLPGATKKYSAADPQSLREKLLESLGESMKSIDYLVNELDSLYKESRSLDSPLDYIEIIKDPFQIHRKFMQLCAQATKEIVMFTKPPYASGTTRQKEEQDDSQFEALKKGVKIKSIYEIPPDGPERVPFVDLIPESARHGEEARVIDELPIKLAVFDERIVLYVMEDPLMGKLSITTIVAENTALAKSFKILFDTIWERARDYYFIGDRKISLSNMKEKKRAKKGSNGERNAAS